MNKVEAARLLAESLTLDPGIVPKDEPYLDYALQDMGAMMSYGSLAQSDRDHLLATIYKHFQPIHERFCNELLTTAGMIVALPDDIYGTYDNYKLCHDAVAWKITSFVLSVLIFGAGVATKRAIGSAPTDADKARIWNKIFGATKTPLTFRQMGIVAGKGAGFFLGAAAAVAARVVAQLEAEMNRRLIDGRMTLTFKRQNYDEKIKYIPR